MHSLAAAALVALVSLVVPTRGHSWVEELDVIDPKTGTFTGNPGYCRNNTKRTAAGFSDPLMVHILPSAGQPAIEERDTIPALDTTGIFPNDTMCKRSQYGQYQSDGNPRLQAAPGDLIALRYEENGHVTLPQNQPGKQANRGWIYIYGTSKPKVPELFLDVFGQWDNATGGDQRGRLLATQPFDDGYCYQVNGGNISTQRQAQFPHTPTVLTGANLWCQNNIALPTDLPTGQPFTLYWVWDWPTEPGVDPNLPKGKAEVYTSCIDIDIVAKPGSKRRVKARQAQSPTSQSALDHLNSAAIPEYVSSLIASPAPAGASPVVSAQTSPAAPEATVTPSAGVAVVGSPTNPTEQVAGYNSMTNPGVASYIENAVSAAIVAEAPKVPLTVTIDIVESVVSPASVATAANQAASPAAAPASTPAASPASMAPVATQAKSPVPASTPPTASTSTPVQAPAPAPAPSSPPPKSLEINPPVLSASPSTSTSVSLPGLSGTASPIASPTSTSVSLPGFSGTASPIASPATESTSVVAAGPAKNSSLPVIASGPASNSMASGASQNGTVAAKGQCTARTCKSKRQSKIFAKKSGGQRL